MSTTTHTLLTLTVAILLLISYQFIGAQTWTPAPNSPPSNNTFAPLNTSSATQTKSGSLIISSPSTVALDVNRAITAGGGISADGNFMQINGAMPNLILDDNDTGMRPMRVRSNDNRMLFITDRSPAATIMLELNAAGTLAQEYAEFSGDVRAENLCTKGGSACARTIDITDVVNRYATTSAITCDRVAWRGGEFGGVAGKSLELSTAEETSAGLNTANRHMVTGDGVSPRCRQLGYDYGIALEMFHGLNEANTFGWCGYSNARTVTWARNSSGQLRWMENGCNWWSSVSVAQCCTIN